MAEISLTKKPRQSNLELFRIITMFLIVAHHYVVNSGLTLTDGSVFANIMSGKAIFMFLFSAWGKIGINCFVFITGYFMCKSQITLKKFLKLLFEVMFYRIVIYLIFLLTGYVPFSVETLLTAIIPIRDLASGFTPAFLVFYLLIPFINILINNLTERQHLALFVITFFAYIFLGSVPGFSVTFNYATWFIVLYIIVSYIRLYPKKIFDSKKFWIIAALVCVLLCSASVLAGVFLYYKTGINAIYYFVMDSNKVLAVATALSLFMMFKNINIKYSKFINVVGASTFGVLLIHANSEAMRNWLWKDVLNNTGAYNTNYFILHAVISVILVYTVCTVIDVLRIKIIETPFFRWFDKIEVKIIDRYKKAEDKFCAKFNIK